MPQWAITVQFTVEAATPDEALAWLREELATKLRPGEAGSPWRPYDASGTPPHFVVGSIRRVADDPGVSARQREGA